MALKKLTDASIPNAVPNGGDIGYATITPLGTPSDANFLFADIAQSADPLNYKIVPTVASNNLTVAIKRLDGTDATVNKPIVFKIGLSWFKLTAALSVTMNAATGWFNAGGSELATQAVDYFVYIGQNATDGITVGVSRVPWARQYSDFSVTSTNEKFAAISSIAHAAATDYYENIGRFEATLSAGAGFTWTIPTYTPLNRINRPTYETRSLVWTPVITAQNAGTIGATTATVKYSIEKNKILPEGVVNISSTGGMTATGAIFLSGPFTPARESAINSIEHTNGFLGWSIYATTPRVSIVKQDGTTFWINTYVVYFNGSAYLI